MSEEILDLVNERDEVIGRASRKEVNKKGLLYRSTGIYAMIGNKVIIEKRSWKKKIRPGNLSIVEETVKSGETYEEAAIRGVKEELGVKPKNLKFIGKRIIRDTVYPDYFLVSVYTCKVPTRLKIQKEEVEKIITVTKKGLNELLKHREDVAPTLIKTISMFNRNF
jgi:isopentenyldiphosphate isomerase